MKEYNIYFGKHSTARDNLVAICRFSYPEIERMIEHNYIDYEIIDGEPYISTDTFWTIILEKLESRQYNRFEAIERDLYNINRNLNSIAGSLEAIADAVQKESPFIEGNK